MAEQTAELDQRRLRAPRFQFRGETFEFVRGWELSFKEARALKTMSGMTPVEVTPALVVGDADAWAGMLTLSIQRTRPEFKVEELDDENLDAISGEVVDDTVAAMKEAESDDALPPTPATPAPSSGSGETD